MISVKVCGIRDTLNAAEIASAGPDFIGFNFYPHSPRYVGDNPEPSLFDNVPRGIIKTGVFVDEDETRLVDISVKYNLKAIQLHGNESPGYCENVRSRGFRVIRAFNVTGDFDFGTLSQFRACCDYFLFDSRTDKHGGSGVKFNWRILADYQLDIPFFLSGGIGPGDTAMIKGFIGKHFFAVDINSRFETAPGKKDAALVKTFIGTIKKIQS
jgi:phosphoribosylanthranilate isomerase